LTVGVHDAEDGLAVDVFLREVGAVRRLVDGDGVGVVGVFGGGLERQRVVLFAEVIDGSS
jgi:hypothetical protein